MLIKRSFLTSCFFCIAAMLSAQIRDYIPIVRPVPYPETIEFLNRLSESMKKEGYDSAAAALKAYTKGTFGSGFVYVSPDGNNYVITNYHVISEAASVTLEFQKNDGSQISYKNCPIIAVDDILDLALIVFANNEKPFKTGLSFLTDNLADGTEVWSAGYPALGDSPSWQFGKGTITNAYTRIPQLIDPEITYLIQHSAVVDPGNSGGPLLVSVSVPAGQIPYKVIGINTWKAANRQAANFSIPAKTIKSFIENALLNKNTNAITLEKRCDDFIKSLKKNNDYKNIVRFISSKYAAKDGELILKNVLSTAPTDVRDEIIYVFTRFSPIEGMKYAIAYKIYTFLTKNEKLTDVSFISINGNADNTDAEITANFIVYEKEIKISWIKEHSLWCITLFPFAANEENAKNKDNTSIAKTTLNEIPYIALLKFGLTLPLKSEGLLYNAGLNLVIDPFTYLGVSIALAKSLYTDPYAWPGENATYEGYFWGAGLEFILQLPIRTDNFLIAPHIGTGAGFEVNTAMSGNGYGISIIGKAGLTFGIGTGSMLIFGIDYRQYIIESEAGIINQGIEIWAGYSF